MLWHGEKLVLQRRVTTLAGRLGFFGGKVEPGETAQEAAVRELGEELGLIDLNPEDLGEELGVVKTDLYQGHIFQYILPDGVVLMPREGHIVERTPDELFIMGNKHGLAELTELAIQEFTRSQ